MIGPDDYPDEPDNGPTYDNGETMVYYDCDGDQHVLVLEDD